MAVAYRPGVAISSQAAPNPRGIPTDTGAWFVVGAGQKGTTTTPQKIRSLSDYEKYFGARSVSSTVFPIYDALDTFFREGGSSAYVVRTEGAAAVAATRTFLDASAGNSLKVSAKSVGTWGNALTVQVIAGVTAGTFVLITFLSGTEVERSPELADQTAAINWSLDSSWITVALPSSPSTLDPAVIAASALSTGADDTAGINDTIRVNALANFTSDLGPGQVSMPGNLTPGNRTALIAHATLNNRFAVLDATDSGTKSAVVSEGQGLQADGNEYGGLFGPNVYIPGLIPNTKRTVAPSGFVAGLMARNDAVNGVNDPSAGSHGLAKYVLGTTQPGFTDADRQDINNAGYNLIRTYRGQPQLYGIRTLGLPTGPWNIFNVQRTRMAIVAKAQIIAERFVFSQLDGKKHTIAQFGGELAGMLDEFRLAGALYGDTPEEAFQVDVSDAVNTPTTIADNQLNAVLILKISGAAELVRVIVTKVATDQQLAA